MSRDYKDQSPAALQRLTEYKRDEWIRAFLHGAKAGRATSARANKPVLKPNILWFDKVLFL